MSELSEEAYCAGWMQDLEYELWSAIAGGPAMYGRLSLDEGVIDKLRQLSERAGGWIVFDDDVGERWVTRDEWIVQFNNWSHGRRLRKE